MLTVGRDSYVTLEEANQIASYTNLSGDKAYIKWLELSDGDKEVLLRNSRSAIDSLKFAGRRKSIGQEVEFPRQDDVMSGMVYRPYISQLYDNGLMGNNGYGDGGLSLVKEAQVVNAVYAGLYNDLTTNEIGLSIQGLSSKKAGPISESYNRQEQNSEDAMIGIYTKKVYSILRSWITDSRASY